MFKLKLKDGTEFNVPNSRLYDSQLQIIDESKVNLLSYEEKLTVDNLSSYSLYDGYGNYIISFADKKYIPNSMRFGMSDGMQIGIYDLSTIDKAEKELNEMKNKLIETQNLLANTESKLVETEANLLDITSKYNLLNDTVAEFILKSDINVTTEIVKESDGE